MTQSSHRLILNPSGRRGDIDPNTTILDAARSLGVEIESICGGRQTCGKCRVFIETGTFSKHEISSSEASLSPPDTAERDYGEKHGFDLPHERLACAACITGDALITIPQESLARKQVIRKEAGDLHVEIAPVVRLYYVEVAPAELGGPADWERVQMALADQWGLQNLKIDPVLLPELSAGLRRGDWSLTLTIRAGREIVRLEPGYVDGLYGMAVDVGSTTIAGHLIDLRTGRVLATESMMNPQIRYGEDLMSRVSYGMMEAQGVTRLNRAIILALNDLIKNAAATVGLDPGVITDLVLVGNTVMHHLLLDIDPVELGGAPFALALSDAVEIKARDLGLKVVGPGACVHILPCIAGHVGADHVAVLLAELPYLDEKVTLTVDIGTNAEILLATADRQFSASSPTGPAFEGAQITHGQRAAPGAIERVRIDRETGAVRYKVIGDERWSDDLDDGESLQPTGICGSGIIEAVAECFLAGLVDKGGLFMRDRIQDTPSLRESGRTAEFVLAEAKTTAGGHDIIITQQDVRAIQLAKAALYAGVRLMMDRMGVDRVDRIKLAGAFGSVIDPCYAMIIGLIPDCNLEQVQSIGNAAGDGARIALLNIEQREAARRVARGVDYVETAVEPAFQDYFVAAMGFPHSEDEFPHLADILPQAVPASDNDLSRRGRRSRRRKRD